MHNQLPIPGQLEQHLPGGGGSGLGQGGRRQNLTRQSSVCMKKCWLCKSSVLYYFYVVGVCTSGDCLLAV